MNAAAPAGLLHAEHVAMINRGVSAIVASHDGQGRTSVMRAIGATITPDGTRITVWLDRDAAAQLLADLRATGLIAVVFSEPTTQRTVQVKASRVELRDARTDEAGLMQNYLAALTQELTSIGFSAAFPQTMLSHRIENLTAVSFTPEEAWDQTPGPKAGASLATGTTGTARTGDAP